VEISDQASERIEATGILPPPSFGGERSIPERFERIVRAYPDRLALSMGERSLTYSELNAYSNRIARTILKKRGPGSEPIALLFEHGIDIIAALLGVLKAGKFYVALNPGFPDERNSFILADAKPEIIITDSKNFDLARALTADSGRVMECGEFDKAIVHDNPTCFVRPEAIASLFYTSGSTGKPKGVIFTHRRQLSTALGSVERGIHPDDRLSLIHFVGFGSASTNLYQSLLNGAGLFPFDVRVEGVRPMTSWLKNAKITVCHMPPALFRQLAEVMPGHEKLNLRLITLSGSPVTRRDFELYKQTTSKNTLLEIMFASSEAGKIASTFVDHHFSFPQEGVPVGYPPPGKKILLLADNGKNVVAGEVGEIVVKGRNLSDGYWNPPDAIIDKFSSEPANGEKTILTGDLGRMLPDGFLIYLGRKDLMVKIRGYRVNISEVESALIEHPGVKEGGAAAWDREPGEKYLAAYVVADTDSPPTVSDLRKFLSAKLPDYMVPSAFVFLDALPLTNGKLDRSALPKPTPTRPELNVPYAAPGSPLEQTLANIWSELLSVDPVGGDDNFFDLGGQSLIGAAILARVKDAFDVELTVADLLQSPTVALMAEAIHRKMGNGLAAEELQRSRERAAIPNPSIRCSSGLVGTFPKEEVEQSIPDRFAKIMRLYPDRIAIESGDRTASYAELNAMAERAACWIIAERGRRPEPVALLIEKGTEQIAAMLGILKAGKFFVPLDLSYPLERTASVIQDSQCALLIADRRTMPIAEKVTGSHCRLVAFEELQTADPLEDLRVSISPDTLACLVYTSGSTGKPKGVIRDHRALLHGAMLRVHTDGIESRDRLAHITNGTSNAVTNVFYVLLQGATLVTYDVKQEGIARLARWLADAKITVCLIASPAFRKLCETLTGNEKFPDLRYLRLRSDTVYKSDVELFNRYFPPTCRFASGLASSETGPLREYPISREVECPGPEVPVGYALPDKEILLLDDSGNEVAPDEVGEIVVRSKYLAVGYWNNPELTQTKFKPDSRDPEKRLFYTGDLGLMRADGCLIHKGRKDSRVKIRGYGVDLLEVERALRSCPEVKDVVVVSRNENNEVRLLAYYTTRVGEPPTVSELRRYLQNRLADYMIPSAFVRLEEMPLTANGKIDRRALPDPDITRPRVSESFVAPRSPTEEMLAGMWLKLLRLDRVGVYDNFFDLGGQSFSGSQLVAWIHEMFHVDLPVSEFFASPTIAELARRIERVGKENPAAGKKTWTYLCELQRGGDRRPIFVFPGGGGGEPEFFVYGFLARHVGAEYPFYGLRARGADGTLRPHTSVEQMADAYVEEIRAMQPEGPYFLMGECAGGVNAYEAARQLAAQGQQVAMLVLMDVERPTWMKYIRFRAGRWLSLESWGEAIRRRWQENYYVARIPHHWKQMRSLPLRDYPRYFLGRMHSALTPRQAASEPADSPRERANAVLRAGASGRKLRHIERVRENYRRTVRRFRPKTYDGRVELLVSEKLYRRNPTLGWKRLVSRVTSVHPLPGDHETYIREHAAVAGRKLRECLERAENRRMPGGA
jgi:amino acid adenylation domain-containing protein